MKKVKKNQVRFTVITTKHMQQKVFMLSQKLGMVKGSRVSVNQIARDAVIEYFDLNNDQKWSAVQSQLNEMYSKNINQVQIGRKNRAKNGSNKKT